MVRYLYECTACQKQFEVEKTMRQAAEPEHCPACGMAGRRIFTAPGISLKGKTVAPECASCCDAAHTCEGCENEFCGE